jgi:hypothetical protein
MQGSAITKVMCWEVPARPRRETTTASGSIGLFHLGVFHIVELSSDMWNRSAHLAATTRGAGLLLVVVVRAVTVAMGTVAAL